MKKEILDLYSDYLLSSFGQVTATGLSRLLGGAVSHDHVAERPLTEHQHRAVDRRDRMTQAEQGGVHQAEHLAGQVGRMLENRLELQGLRVATTDQLQELVHYVGERRNPVALLQDLSAHPLPTSDIGVLGKWHVSVS